MARLSSHEKGLLLSGDLLEVSHPGASALLLEAACLGFQKEVGGDMVSVYRHMTDAEAEHLLEHGVLPTTQPYQTIVVGEEGYAYCASAMMMRARF